MKSGTLNRDVVGNFMTWEKGTRVHVSYPEGFTGCKIERISKRGLCLADVMFNVPEAAITLDPKTEARPEEVYGYAAEIKLKDGGRQWRVYRTQHQSVAAVCARRVADLLEVARMLPLTRKQYDAARANLAPVSAAGGMPKQQVYGYAVDIELPAGRTIRKYWKVNQRSLAMQHARLVSGAVRTLRSFPLDKAAWDAAHTKR